MVFFHLCFYKPMSFLHTYKVGETNSDYVYKWRRSVVVHAVKNTPDSQSRQHCDEDNVGFVSPLSSAFKLHRSAMKRLKNYVHLCSILISVSTGLPIYVVKNPESKICTLKNSYIVPNLLCPKFILSKFM